MIAGQGTLAVELLRQAEGPLTVVCPIGGGGLASGVALWATAAGDVRVVGVECEASPAMRAALAADRIVPVEVRPMLADGLGGNLEPGTVTFDLVRRLLADVVVGEDEIEEAIRFLQAEHGVVAEGAGAVAVAALVGGRVAGGRGRPVALVTGRNTGRKALLDVLQRQ